MARHQLDRAAVQRLLTNPRGGVSRDFYRRAKRVEAIAKREVGVDSTHLRNSIRTQPLRGRYAPGYEVGSDLNYAMHHLRGHKEIRPVKRKALRFKPRGSGRFVFAMKVKAVEGNPFLQKALRLGVRGR
jgi:hypothetical protein